MSRPADLLFTGGPVHTMDPRRPRASLVAVRNGVIIAVAGDAESPVAAELTGPRTEVVDLRGRALIPGFQDAHVHPAFAGITMLRCDLSGARDLDEALELIRRYAASRPGHGFLTGGGWHKAWFPHGVPGRELLDRIAADRPVYLAGRDGHAAWVNTRALELAGVDSTTPDPPYGRIGREADGAPCGALFESATELVAAMVPPPTAAERRSGLLAAQAHLHALGVTAWQDAIIGPYLGFPDPYEDYLALAGDDRLTARVVGALWWDRERGPEQLGELLERRAHGRCGRFRATSVKIMQDGVTGNRTAGLLDPYLDPGAQGCGCTVRGERGISHLTPQELAAAVTLLDVHGFQVHVHAIGDRAVREALDAVAAARTGGATADGPPGRPPGGPERRHHIAHAQVVHPDDLRRFAALGVTATVQPLWAAHDPDMDELTIPLLGRRRAAWQYPFRALTEAGARLAAGSDWAVSSADPLQGLHVAVNRVLPGSSLPPFLPGQRLDLATALAAYTRGSAYVNHLDDRTGSIEPGKLADLVVLDRDPFACPPADIAATRVTETFVEGERVHPR